MRIFFHLARNTFRECLREPVFLLLLLTALFLIGMFPSLALFSFREQTKLVIDSAMATTLVFGLVAAVFCSAQAVTREIRNGTVLMLLAKPVPRGMFIHAKMAGVLAAMSVFVFICAAAILVSIRVAKDQFNLDYLAFFGHYATLALAVGYGGVRNYFARRNFAAATILALAVLLPLLVAILTPRLADGEPVPFPTEVLLAIVALLFAVWIMCAITVTLATRLDLTSNLIGTATIFLLGLVSDYGHGLFAQSGFVARSIAGTLYLILPNWQFFWLADALAAQQAIPGRYLAWLGLYLILYLAGCAMVAAIMFGGREVGDETSG